ncbi:hypothetical protein JHN52_24475 [Streptomyces sp. MBT97]|uniref:hypothetical protein n=1 Tax=Streptomyces sp. MBT97 TaxID=2800411 RepID=UPI00190A7A5E|nr:hypothetical protein [Streptomyces sp. MBT97]MBK3636024.1 hypothetical protein [Streptomyces sp. MBT97]
MADKLTRDLIQKTYSDPEIQERILRINFLAEFLGSCIISESYEAPPRIAASIKLSSAGAGLVSRIQSNANPRNECTISVFLQIFWNELLVDPAGTNIEAIEKAISDEIKKERILFPYIYGRELYDKAFNELKDNNDTLTHKDTMTLLAGTPQGVFQLHDYVTGPWGLMRSREIRYCPPSVWVPLFHCDDLSCMRLHNVLLETGASKISKVRNRTREVLSRQDSAESEWSEFLRDLVTDRVNPFSWRHPAGIPSLIGDAFSTTELRFILNDLLNTTKGGLRASLSGISQEVREAERFTEDLNEAQILQLILLCRDEEIIDTLDSLILSGSILIPSAEIRKSPRVVRATGYFDLVPECASRGVRFWDSASQALLRSRHLISNLFDLGNPAQRERLEWLIRGTDGASFQEQLDQFVCGGPLDGALGSLIFDSGTNLAAAEKFVGIGPRARERLSNEESLRRAITWRLGIDGPSESDALLDFRQYGARLRELAMRTHTYASADQADIRAVASNFFVKVEGLLQEYLKIATWSLLRDHYATSGFVYSPEEAISFTAQELGSEQVDIQFSDDGKWTLFPMIRGFDILATRLKALKSEETTRRPVADYPKILRSPSPYTFLFKHIYPYLDLDATARSRIAAMLSTAAQKLQSGKVDEIRNILQHTNPKFPTQDEVLGAINAAETVLAEAEEAGFLPVVSRLRESQTDSYGRRTVTLGTANGKTLRLVRPSSYYLTGLPVVSEAQYVLRSAIYENSSEVLRLSIREDSEYTKRWSDYPKRRGARGKSGKSLLDD